MVSYEIYNRDLTKVPMFVTPHAEARMTKWGLGMPNVLGALAHGAQTLRPNGSVRHSLGGVTVATKPQNGGLVVVTLWQDTNPRKFGIQ